MSAPKIKPLDDRDVLTSTFVRAAVNLPPCFNEIIIEQPQVSETIGSYDQVKRRKKLKAHAV